MVELMLIKTSLKYKFNLRTIELKKHIIKLEFKLKPYFKRYNKIQIHHFYSIIYLIVISCWYTSRLVCVSFLFIG